MSNAYLRLTTLTFALGLACATVACTDDGETETQDPETTGDGDGDPASGDGDPTGDGDGDPTGDGDGDPGLTFTGDIYPIIAANCSCHIGGGPGGLSMPDADTAYANLVSVASSQEPELSRIEPNDAAGSYLHQKVAGTQVGLGPGNHQMPRGPMPESPNPLSDADQDLIADWIDEGAVL